LRKQKAKRVLAVIVLRYPSAAAMQTIFNKKSVKNKKK